jgi:hypothetical protein
MAWGNQMALFKDIFSWLGDKGLFALLGASLVVILVTNITIKTRANLIVLSLYDFINMAMLLGLAAGYYFLSFVCKDLSSYGFFGVAPTVFFAAAPTLILFFVRAPLFTDTKFSIAEHIVLPLAAALMMALLIYPFLLMAKRFIFS